VGGDPFYLKFWVKVTALERNLNNKLRYEIGCQLLLITNRKLRTGFRLVLTSMTLNDLERRNSPYFAFFFTEFDRFSGRL